MRNRLLLVAWIAVISTGHLSAETNAPSSETDGAKFVRLTNQLERNPLEDADKSVRGWLINWATKSEDVTVTICDILAPIPAQNVPYDSEILTQMIFGNASFQIAHPNQKSNVTATQLAGVRSSMRAYASIIAKHPEAHIPYFDDLLSKEQAGSLETFMTPVIEKGCSEKDGG